MFSSIYRKRDFFHKIFYRLYSHLDYISAFIQISYIKKTSLKIFRRYDSQRTRMEVRKSFSFVSE